MRDEVSTKIKKEFENSISLADQLMDYGLSKSGEVPLSVYMIHYSNLHTSCDANIKAFQNAQHLGVPVLFFYWSEYQTQKKQDPLYFLELKRLMLHSKSPIFYVLMGCVSIHTFLSDNISNYALAHEHASLYIPEQERYIFAKETHEKGLVDAVFSESYPNFAITNNNASCVFKARINQEFKRYKTQNIRCQKERLLRHLKATQVLEEVLE